MSRRTRMSKKEKAAKRVGEEIRGTADKQDSSAALQENRQQDSGFKNL